jgi:tape measure domain-containing protein
VATKKLSWVFALFDRMSGPARKIGKSLDDVEKKLGKTDRALGKHERQTQRAAGSTRKLGDAHRHAAKHGAGFFTKLTGWYLSMQMGIATVQGLARALFGLPTAFAKAGLSAASFKERSLLGLGTMLGSPQAGASLFAEADRMAKATGTPLREMVDRYSQLTAMGFQGERLRQVLAGVGDLSIVGGQDKAARALLAITQIKAKGRLSAEELMQQLAETGVDIDAVYGILGRRTGLDREGVRKAMEKGQIGADLGIDSILEFIQGRYSGGALGSMAAKYSKTGAGLWANLSSTPDRFLMDLDKSAGYQKAKKALENLVAVLDPETPAGKRLKAKATEMFDRIFGGLFDQFQDPKAVEQWVGKLVEGFGNLIPLAERLAKSVGSAAANIEKIALFAGVFTDPVGAAREIAGRATSDHTPVDVGPVGHIVQRYRALMAKEKLNFLDRAELDMIKGMAAKHGLTLPPPSQTQPPALDPSHKPTSFQFGKDAIRIEVNGAGDPKAVGDEVESRLAFVFERLAAGTGAA